MSLKIFFSCLVMCLCANFCEAQVSDDFNDDLQSNPQWIGDTSAFLINDQQKLQLNAPYESGAKCIYTVSESIENAVWEFEVEMDFNPSSSNYADVYLAVDSANYEHASGYFVRLGNTSDEVSLYRQDGTPAEKTRIIDGTDKTLDSNPATVKVKVLRDGAGNWKLLSDIGITGIYISEGEAFDDTYLSSNYFGIFCHYTSTRADKFTFDNIAVSGDPKSDVQPPKVANLNILDDVNMQIVFSEKIILGDDPEMNFLNNCDFSQPQEVNLIKDSVVELNFDNPFPENKSCQLLINNIKDKAQNLLPDTSISFKYVPPKQPEFNELLITEVMADPTPNVELPEYEYLEIYNPLGDIQEVKGLKLQLRGETTILDDFTIGQGEYILLCPNSATAFFANDVRVLGVSNWKALLNNGDTIVLKNKYDDQVFSLAYEKEWFNDLDKSEGGYSLEMIDINNPCGDELNWKASVDASGGTPGQPNSVAASNPDLTSPGIVNIYPLTAKHLQVDISEKILNNIPKIQLNPSIAISDVTIEEPLQKSIAIDLEDSLVSNKIYAISVSKVKDCVGNRIEDSAFKFVLPQKADSLDVVFNEIMFNPVPAGVDFIELINLSEKYIDLKNWKLLRESDGSVSEEKFISNKHILFAPQQIIVLTSDIDVLKGQYPNVSEGSLVETDLPAMNDDEGTILLVNEKGEAIDVLYYNEEFHHPMLKNREGVSLERISYNSGSGNSEIWQSAASTVGYATPGHKNSQYLNETGNTSFSIEPKVFAPNNDGYKDFTSINFELNGNYLASLFIYDISGRIVKQLLNNQNLPTEGFVIWEGDDDSGRKVSMGNYIVYLELIGQGGEKKVYKDKVAVAAKF